MLLRNFEYAICSNWRNGGRWAGIFLPRARPMGAETAAPVGQVVFGALTVLNGRKGFITLLPYSNYERVRGTIRLFTMTFALLFVPALPMQQHLGSTMLHATEDNASTETSWIRLPTTLTGTKPG